jgi:hypothetical protein
MEWEKSRSRKMVLKGTYQTHENVKAYCARRALERGYVFCLSDAGWVGWRKVMCTIKLASRSAQACRSAATDMGVTMLHRDQTLQMLSDHPEWLVGLDGMGLVCPAHLISIYLVMLLLFLWGLPWCMLLLLLPLLSCLFILLVWSSAEEDYVIERDQENDIILPPQTLTYAYQCSWHKLWCYLAS